MSIWARIAEALAALAKGEGLDAVFERLRSPPDRSVAFTIAVIALGAKIAKADGLVTRDEVSAFREVFTIAPEDEEQAARVYNLARQDVAGFEDYAIKIKRMFAEDEAPLADLLEGLFHIALADGAYHVSEDAYLARVADLFGFAPRRFAQIRARFIPAGERDPWQVLGATRDMSLAEVRRLWRAEVRASHPDALTARGLPEEAVKLGEARLVAINRAWDEISAKTVS